jgi:hypothetical protein
MLSKLFPRTQRTLALIDRRLNRTRKLYSGISIFHKIDTQSFLDDVEYSTAVGSTKVKLC